VTRPNPAQIAGGLLLLLIVALLSMELLKAAGSVSCPAGPDCYPWGAEGPAAGVWSYASKTNYLIRGFAQLVLVLGAGLFLIWRAGRDTPFSRLDRLAPCAVLAASALLVFV
jgi:hypothetical protein